MHAIVVVGGPNFIYGRKELSEWYGSEEEFREIYKSAFYTDDFFKPMTPQWTILNRIIDSDPPTELVIDEEVSFMRVMLMGPNFTDIVKLPIMGSHIEHDVVS